MKKASLSNERAITKDELELMLKKYNIGKKPLAKLLGWGETTIVLYCGSDAIPDGEYARRLGDLYRNPGRYLELLSERGGFLTDVARKKTYAAVSRAILSDRLFVFAQYIINRAGGSVSLLRLQAVLLFAQTLSLSLYGVELFDEDYRPDAGHIPYRSLKKHFIDVGSFVLDLPEGALSAAEREIVDSVTDAFEWYGPRALAVLLESEHKRLCPDEGRGSRKVASKERIKRCYREVFSINGVNGVKDFEGYLHKRMTRLRQKR